MSVADLHDSGLDFLRLTPRRRASLVRQSEGAECGLCCLAMVAEQFGYKTDIVTLRRQFSISLKGTSLKTLIDIADEIGFNSRPLRLELQELAELSLPAILHWDLHHFVVLVERKRTLKGTRYVVLDPAHGELILTEAELSQRFTGVALELSPSERFQRKTERAPFRITQMWSKLVGIGPTLAQVLVLSLLLQLFTFATPFFMQLAVDSAVPAFDKNFLAALAGGFAALAVLNFATGALRELILLRFGNALGYQLVANLFRQLIRLPMGYFEKRHTGDVISRFESTQPITAMLSRGLISAFIDGVMALLTLAVMFYYSALFTGIAVASLMVYVAVRVAYFNALRMANADVITAAAAESSTMIETIRGMAAIKIFAREGDRQRHWQARRAEVVNATVKLGRLQVWFDAANTGVMALENVLFLYLAVAMVIDAKFTIGMIFAFQAYKQQFLGASMRLVGQWIEFRILDVHLARIADIGLTSPEQLAVADRPVQKTPVSGALEVANVHFAYGKGENEVLKGVSLSIKAGETLAIIGPSGGGKSTLMKLMLGFYPPTFGDVRLDGESLTRYGLHNYRRQIGAVLQEDVLYAGSLAENIGFFDQDLDMEKVWRAARLACIHDEIMAMPMAYESLVGDMGSTLSGGQKQRVLLARALYCSPRILFLDEGTAHLDVRTEAMVSASIAKLGITRIIIAHRPETIRTADRVVALVDGKAMEVVNNGSNERKEGGTRNT